MYAIFDFVPWCCPNCGFHPLLLTVAETNYRRHTMYACPKCKLLFQYAETEHIMAAAKQSGGDME